MRVKLHIPSKSTLLLECTVAEAEANVYPLLNSKEMEQSRNYVKEASERWQFGEEDMSQHPHDIYAKKVIKYPACFNINIELSKIEPAPSYLPYSHMWNGYCPYELTDEILFSDFNDLKKKYQKEPQSL